MYTLGVGSYLAGIISSTRSSLSRPDYVHVTNLCHHHSRKEEVRVCLLTAVQQFISAVQQHDRSATPMCRCVVVNLPGKQTLPYPLMVPPAIWVWRLQAAGVDHR